MLASLFTALVAGVSVLLFGKPLPDPPEEKSGGCCSAKPVAPCCGSEKPAPPSLMKRALEGQHYAFGDLFVMLAPYFFLGLIATGLIAALVPPEFLQRHAGGGIASMLLMLAIGIPIYICASGSTPLVAGLIATGMSPGTALVLLLAGPATNIATMAVVRKMMGTRGLLLYLGSIAVCSLLAGLGVDYLHQTLGFAMGRPDLFGHDHGADASLLAHVGAVIFIALTLWGTFVLKIKPLLNSRKPAKESCH